jgi:hypothetical protein
MHAFGEDRAGFERAAADLQGPRPVCQSVVSPSHGLTPAEVRHIIVAVESDPETREARVVVRKDDPLSGEAQR